MFIVYVLPLIYFNFGGLERYFFLKDQECYGSSLFACSSIFRMFCTRADWELKFTLYLPCGFFMYLSLSSRFLWILGSIFFVKSIKYEFNHEKHLAGAFVMVSICSSSITS